MNGDFSRDIFEKHWNIKFHENPSSGSRVVPCGRTDRRTDKWMKGWTDRRADKQTDRETEGHDEANSHFW